MSSIRLFYRLTLLIMAWLTVPALLAQTHPLTSGVACPDSTDVTTTASSPAGWIVEPSYARSTVLRISIFQKNSVGKEYELAPDDTTTRDGLVAQSWSIPHEPTYRIYLRCYYKDTNVTLLKELGVQIKECKFSFKTNAHGIVAEPTLISCH